MNFHSPHLLWLLVPLLLLFSWELARRAGAAGANLPKVARAWAGAFAVSLGAKHTTAESRPRLWLWFGLALCLIALARPQWGVIEERVFDQSREVLIAVDLSRSMLADDVKPNRLERAKLLITSLLDRLQGERVGLVLFAGTSFLQVPLSADYEIFREFLPALRPEYLPEGGSNYKAMLETSIQAFGTSAADRYLIILSDGESTEEGWRELGPSLKNKSIRVIGLGIGSTQGAFIPDGSGGLVKDERGAVVLSRLNSSTLQELAQVTGGAYTDASSWVDLPGLLSRTVEAGQKGDFSEKNTARLVERFQWFLAPGLLLLLISFWAEFPVRPRERTLPLGGVRKSPAPPATPVRATPPGVAAVALLFGLSFFGGLPAAHGQDDTLAKPLTTTVARLAGKPNVSAKEYAELAQATITFAERVKGTPQKAPSGVIRDGLAAVDAGEAADAKAADWPHLRAELEKLLEKEEPEEEQKPEEQQQQDQQQQQSQQQQQQQNQQNQNQQQSQDEKQQPSEQQNQQDQSSPPPEQSSPAQDAFGDMKDSPEPPPGEKEGEEAPPQPPMQKVGGQKEKKERPSDPDLAMPLQKLEQVRELDSPARLQSIMQGKQQTPPKKGKDW